MKKKKSKPSKKVPARLPSPAPESALAPVAPQPDLSTLFDMIKEMKDQQQALAQKVHHQRPSRRESSPSPSELEVSLSSPFEKGQTRSNQSIRLVLKPSASFDYS